MEKLANINFLGKANLTVQAKHWHLYQPKQKQENKADWSLDVIFMLISCGGGICTYAYAMYVFNIIEILSALC